MYNIFHAPRELGRKERESFQKMAEITKEGFLLKKQLIEEAKRGQLEKQVRLSERRSDRAAESTIKG